MRALPPLLALALAAAGCLSAAPAPEPAACDPARDAACPGAAAPAAPVEALAFTNATGTLVALPVVGGEQRFAYDVPQGAAWVAATLKWETRGTALELVGTDPGGQVQGQSRTLAGSSPRSPARLDWWSPAPAAGAWSFDVRGQAALQEPLFLQFHTAERVAGMHVAEALEVPAGRFAEVNMLMKRGDTITYAWSSAQPLAFDIHTHRGGETILLVEETTTGMEATFTADEDGGFSLLWAQPGGGGPAVPGAPAAQGVALGYRIDGAFELHSAVG